jgi:hypothetical protein
MGLEIPPIYHLVLSQELVREQTRLSFLVDQVKQNNFLIGFALYHAWYHWQ